MTPITTRPRRGRDINDDFIGVRGTPLRGFLVRTFEDVEGYTACDPNHVPKISLIPNGLSLHDVLVKKPRWFRGKL